MTTKPNWILALTPAINLFVEHIQDTPHGTHWVCDHCLLSTHSCKPLSQIWKLYKNLTFMTRVGTLRTFPDWKQCVYFHSPKLVLINRSCWLYCFLHCCRLMYNLLSKPCVARGYIPLFAGENSSCKWKGYKASNMLIKVHRNQHDGSQSR